MPLYAFGVHRDHDSFFFYTAHRSIQALAWREQTRRWWLHHRAAFELCTSEAVIRELEASSPPLARQRIALVADIPRLNILDRVEEVAEAYMKHQLMPRESLGDAVHLALASVHGVDFVLTWNCRHLANANKAAHLAAINRRLRLAVPALVTPYNLS